jgi:hypothetical protein
MRVGFASIYSWRPHVEHLYFLATLAQRAGHEVFFLACDGDLPNCYARESLGRSAWRECLQCRIGGIRSYSAQNVDSLGQYMGAPPAAATPAQWAYSSASTLGRFESNAEYASSEFRAIADRLQPVVSLSYAAAKAWMTERNIEAVCVFNGRMDATRAVFEAAKALGIQTVTLERTWFGDGLQLYPNQSCLGLAAVHDLVGAWKSRALTQSQALVAASHIGSRFLRRNAKEWRAYNTEAKRAPWPGDPASRKILLVPSSRNEVWGHPDWESAWSEPLVAYDAVIGQLGLKPHEIVLRCHPNWSEHIGTRDGSMSERYYTEWARRRGFYCIPSADKTSTLGLIEDCDAIVVANGSAALEAGILGKQVIGTAPSIYQAAGLRDSALSEKEVELLELNIDRPEGARQELARAIATYTLRFCYSMVYRVAQYTEEVRADATTRYRYDFDAKPDRFLDLLRTGRLTANNSDYSETDVAERQVLDLIAARDWEAVCTGAKAAGAEFRYLARRPLFRVVDLIARWKPVGDR